MNPVRPIIDLNKFFDMIDNNEILYRFTSMKGGLTG